MTDMLSAFHFIRYLELREKEQQPYREFVAEKRASAGLGIFRKFWRRA
jgi:hypothetical protein